MLNHFGDILPKLLWQSVAEVARAHDCHLICLTANEFQRPDFGRQANALYHLVSPDRLDGLICWGGPIMNAGGAEAVSRILAQYRALPIVIVESEGTGYVAVVPDCYEGVRAMMRHLVETHGYRRIAFVRGPDESHEGARQRYQAYLDALNAYRLPVEPDLISPSSAGRWGFEVGEEAIALFLGRLQTTFEAVVCANDNFAIGVMRALQMRGIQVPQQVAVTGFDDQYYATCVMPAISTVSLEFYEYGRQAAETLLTLLNGGDAPQTVRIPLKLLIRESCGCVNPDVALTAPLTITGDRMAAISSSQREQFVTEIVQRFAAEKQIDPDALLRLLTGFFDEFEPERAGGFLPTLTAMLRQAVAADEQIAAWQHVVFALRGQLLPHLHHGDALYRAENLWRQAQIMLDEAMQIGYRKQIWQLETQTRQVNRVGASLITTTFDLAELMDMLRRELPRLGIPGCYLALYDRPRPYAFPTLPAEWSHLIFAQANNERLALPPGGIRFPTSQLIPPEMLPQSRRCSLLVESLYFRDEPLGVVAFEEGPIDAMIYDVLRDQISSAIQGAMLVRRVQERTAEVIRQKHILDTFLANVPDSIYVKDRQSRILRSNQAHAASFGLENPEQLLGKTDFDFFPEEIARSKYEQEQEILRSGRPLLALEEQEAGGRWVLTTKMPLRDEHGDIIGTFGISRDITALKQAERDLRQYQDHLEELVADRTAELARSNASLHAEILERRRIETELTRSNARLHEEILERHRAEDALSVSEQQYRLLAENVRDGIVIAQQRRLVFANTGFTLMIGETLDRLLQRDPAAMFQAEDAPPLFEWLEHGRDLKAESVWQARILTSDQRRTVWAELEQTPMVWNGQPAALLTIRDITDRKLREQRLEEERVRLQQENIRLKSAIKDRYRFGELIGKSSAMQRVYELIINAASSEVNVLVVGESGTGKELIAQTVHQISRRKAQNFVPVNCASIPETLFEREFFGHRKGAFTGADRDAPGLFDRAHRGTLFLDEVTELTPATQAKLLRVLQDGVYTPLGGTVSKHADALIVAATNKDCREEILRGRLRKDFFYRIAVIEIAVPQLRERKEDLPLLIEHILAQYRQKQADIHGSVPPDLPKDQSMLPAELAQALYAYAWPGNVRELQNVLQRYAATRDLNAVLASLGMSARTLPSADAESLPTGITMSEAVEALEKRLIGEAFVKTGHHIGKTSEMLAVPRRTLERKIKRYRL